MDFFGVVSSRRLHGRRGLKFGGFAAVVIIVVSPPSRAAWIEMFFTIRPLRPRRSPPSRAAWIEIIPSERLSVMLTVAAFTGGVD